jgi:hypothetical protein
MDSVGQLFKAVLPLAAQDTDQSLKQELIARELGELLLLLDDGAVLVPDPTERVEVPRMNRLPRAFQTEPIVQDPSSEPLLKVAEPRAVYDAGKGNGER